MVLSDGMVHFLKSKNFLKQIYQNYLVALTANNSLNEFGILPSGGQYILVHTHIILE